jgi:transposase
MGREDRIEMSQRDLKRLHVIQAVLEAKLKQVEAAEILDLSDRQIRRMSTRLKGEGEHGMVHRLRGRPSNRRTSEKLKARALELYETHYGDFGPTLAAEKLSERDGIGVSDETLRLWLIEAGVPYKGRKKRKHRQWRERKASLGEMIQMDGSHHDWLEGRGPELVLMGYIDDATNRVFARFYDYEGTLPALDSFKRYITRYGIPQSLYLDKHGAYKPAKDKPLEIADQLAGRREALSQFGRACEELEVQVIYAHSPQAKGRIERQFRTFQHRLIRELRLYGAKSLEEANRVLGSYLPKYNRRFEVPAANPADLHRPVPQGINLKSIFSTKEKRTLRNDWTIAYGAKYYQILDKIQARTITVEERLDGSLHLMNQGASLHFKEIPVRVQPKPKPKLPSWMTKRRHVPPTHPWKAQNLFRRKEALLSQ